MANTVAVEIRGTTWQMPASYRASREVAQVVGDPLQMAIAAHQKGSIDLSVEQIVDLVAIGVRHAGCSLSRDDIGEAVIEGGLINYVKVAGDYIGAMVSGGPEKPLPVGKKKG